MAEVKVLGTIALKGVLMEYAPEFQEKTGHGIAPTWGPTGVVYDKCRTGEAFDVLIGVPECIETMSAEGYAVAATQVDFTKSIVGVAVKKGTPHPKIDTVEDLKAALRAAKSVAYTDPATMAASGLYVAKLLEDWGMTEEDNAKAKFGRGGPVAEFLVTDEAEIALQQYCEHMLVPGVDVVGPVPDEIQKVSTMSAALHTKAPAAEAAKSLIAWLAAPETHEVLRRHGLFAPHEV